MLHVGDSMVESTGAPGASVGGRFTEVLSTLVPDSAHLNAGKSDTGPDAYYLAVRAWRKLLRIDLVVVYFFPGNDVTDLDRPYVCCGQESLLRFAGDRVTARCAAPRWPSRHHLWWLNSPPPFPLRAATGGSRFADHATWLLYHKPASNFRDRASLEELRWRHLGSTLRELRDELRAAGVPLVVVLLPFRECLDPRTRGRRQVLAAVPGRFLALTASLGIRTLNAWELFESLLLQQPASRWFFTSPAEPTNAHFNPEGHRFLAEWLAQQISWPAGLPPTSAPAPQPHEGCVFLPGTDHQRVKAHVAAWAAQAEIERVLDASVALDQASATVTVLTGAGAFTVTWSLDRECRVGPGVSARPGPGFHGRLPSPGALRQLTDELPAARGAVAPPRR